MGARRTVAITWLVVGAIACGSSGAPGTPPDPPPTADQPDASAAGGAGGKPALPDAATTTAGGSAGTPADAAPPPTLADAGEADAPPVSLPPDAGEPLGAFPLEAVKAAKIEAYAGAGAHLEGPSWRDGELFFAADGGGWGWMRIDANRKLFRYHPKLAPVGSYALADRSILVCDHNYVLVQVFADGQVAQLATDFEGKAIEYCNDVAADAAGNLYLSGRHSGTVYRVSPAGEVVKVATGLDLPNGVEVSPDGKTLYIGTAKSILRLALPGSGSVFAKPSLVAPAGQPDGFAFDAWGNLWVADWAAKHLTIIAPDDHILATVATGGGPVNLTFGGPNGDTVFLENDFKGLYKLGPVPGLRGSMHPGAPRYQIEKMLDLVPANTPVN
jgi:sugar lactone lactonase YvrE